LDRPARPPRRQRHGGRRHQRPRGAGILSMQPWLSIVGIGEDGLDGLSPAARVLVDGAEILVGGARHLAMLPPDDRPRHEWPRPLAPLVERIAGWRGRRVCVLASGDPMWFGIGVTLARRIRAAE